MICLDRGAIGFVDLLSTTVRAAGGEERVLAKNAKIAKKKAKVRRRMSGHTTAVKS
jgi:hypothetical protein